MPRYSIPSGGGWTLYPGEEEPIGGTDPNNPPTWIPPGYGIGWWEFINGAWRWVSDPAPKTVKP